MLCKILGVILKGSFEQRAGQLVQLGRENPAWMRDLLPNISKKLRQRTELPHDHPPPFLDFSRLLNGPRRTFLGNIDSIGDI